VTRLSAWPLAVVAAVFQDGLRSGRDGVHIAKVFD
jgi:hypothetical protein